MPSVALDAGHYTKTSGKRSPDETYFEYEFNWDLCLKIQAHLERCGITVYPTRSYVDSTDDLAARVKLANSKKVDFFFSVHTNAAGNTGWYNSARGYSAHIYLNSTKSRPAATKILNTVFPTMNTKYGLKNRGVVEQDLYVTRVTTMQAVLVEHAFHSSEDDVKLLKSQEFRRDMAELEAKTICELLNVKWIASASISSDHKFISIGKTNTSNVIVRGSASNTGKKLSILHKNCQVEIISKTNKFYKINYGSKYGYVAIDSITETNTNIPDEYIPKEESKMTVIKTGSTTADSLRVRSTPYTTNSSNVLGYIKKNTVVNIVGVASNGWYQIEYNNGYAYISDYYVTNVKNVEVEEEPKKTSITVTELKAMGYTTIILK